MNPTLDCDSLRGVQSRWSFCTGHCIWSEIIMWVFNLALLDNRAFFYRQEAWISIETLISPPPIPCSLPQETALLRHAPVSAALSGQNPNSENIFTTRCG